MTKIGETSQTFFRKLCAGRFFFRFWGDEATGDVFRALFCVRRAAVVSLPDAGNDLKREAFEWVYAEGVVRR